MHGSLAKSQTERSWRHFKQWKAGGRAFFVAFFLKGGKIGEVKGLTALPVQLAHNEKDAYDWSMAETTSRPPICL